MPVPKSFSLTRPAEINTSLIKQSLNRIPIQWKLDDLIEGHGLADVLWAFADHARTKAGDLAGEPGLEGDQKLWADLSKMLMKFTDRAVDIGL
jgi:hypothetical protein